MRESTRTGPSAGNVSTGYTSVLSVTDEGFYQNGTQCWELTYLLRPLPQVPVAGGIWPVYSQDSGNVSIVVCCTSAEGVTDEGFCPKEIQCWEREYRLHQCVECY